MIQVNGPEEGIILNTPMIPMRLQVDKWTVSMKMSQIVVAQLLEQVTTLMKTGEFGRSIEILQQAMRKDTDREGEIHYLFAKNYICLGCHYQAYYHLIQAWNTSNASVSGKDGTVSDVARMLVKCSCKIAKFDTSRVVLEGTASLTVEQKEELFKYTREEKSRFLRSVDESIGQIQSPYGSEEIRNILMSGQMIKCKTPHLPNSIRKSEVVLDTVNRRLAQLGVDTIELRVVDKEADCYGLFARKEIQSGELILEEIPYVAVNSENNVRRCYHCCRKITSGEEIRCQNKCAMIYCSDICRRRALEQYHSPLCGIDISNLVQMVSRGRSSTSRFPLMCYKILGRALMTDSLLVTYPSRYNDLNLLYRRSNSEDYEMPPNAPSMHETFCSILDGTMYGRDVFLGVEWMIDCYELLLLNAICLPDGESDDVLQQSQALLSIGSFFNHHKTPNCSWTGQYSRSGELQAVFRATKMIRSGEQVFISYTNDAGMLKYLYGIE